MRAREQVNMSIISNKQKVLDYYLPLYEMEAYKYKEIIGSTHKSIVTPVFLTKEKNRLINEDLNRVVEVLFRLPEISFGGDYEKYFNELCFGEQVKEVLHKYKFRKQHLNLMRPDCIYDGKNLKLLEFNISSSLGGILTNDILGGVIQRKLMDNIGLLLEDKCDFFNVSGALSKYLKKSVPGKKEITLALIYRNENYESRKIAIMHIKRLLEGTGIKVLMCDPRDLIYDDGLKLGSQTIDIAYRLFLWNFKEFEGNTVLEPIIKAVDEDKVELFVHVASRMYSAKANLALLSVLSDSAGLSSDTRKAIDRIIPWTRILSDCKTMYKGQQIDLAEYILRNKDEFIIKPSVSSAGRQVFIGKDSSIGEWNSQIEQNIGTGTMVVQEFHKAIQIKLPIVYEEEKDIRLENNLCLFSPFLINGRIEGYFVRCQSIDKKIINLANGALPTCVVLV